MEIILIADKRILSVPIKDNQEPLIDLKANNLIAFGPSPEIPDNTDYTKMRGTVYEKLVEAQKLLPDGLKFCLYEGYRSLSLQEKLFNERYQILASEHPHWSKENIFIETTRMVAPVTNFDGSRNIPPHATGAAIDLYLVDENGEIVDMGIKVDDWLKDVDGSLSQTDSVKISQEARKNRVIMSQALAQVGFVNCPTEYWHWSYGDRYWAYHKNSVPAFYGII